MYIEQLYCQGLDQDQDQDTPQVSGSGSRGTRSSHCTRTRIKIRIRIRPLHQDQDQDQDKRIQDFLRTLQGPACLLSTDSSPSFWVSSSISSSFNPRTFCSQFKTSSCSVMVRSVLRFLQRAAASLFLSRRSSFLSSSSICPEWSEPPLIRR